VRAPAPRSRWGRHATVAVLALAGLGGVVVVHGAGQTLLALTLLAITALALWAYGSPRTQALRYLFPGIATALVFVVFPMAYTVGMGFTNQSGSHLLDQAHARANLLEEVLARPGSARPFSLHADGTRWRLRLGAAESESDSGSGAGSTRLSPPLALDGSDAAEQTLSAAPAAAAGGAASATTTLAPAAPLREVLAHLGALRRLRLRDTDGSVHSLASLRAFAVQPPRYTLSEADGALVDQLTQVRYLPDAAEGFFTSADGERLQPGYRVGVGLRHYAQVFTNSRFRAPFASVFVWTVVFSALSVAGATALGLLLSVLLNWDALRGKGAYRLVLFLPYAVPGFISILVFKGLFNQNLGEVNLILGGLFGIRPAWFSDPLLAKAMLLFVNVWLGFPYMMVLCTGLIKAIPADLAEASAVLGIGPWAHFRHVTLPLILRPLTPLLISAFAFNFNNFVLISLLTGGRPDQLDTSTPAGTTDILVSYTWRIAFQDSGQQFGLAAAISTIIFLIVAAITLLQMRLTRLADEPVKK